MANDTLVNCFKNATMTWSEQITCFWRSPRGIVIRIEVPVVLAATVLLFMATFGSWRRRSRNFFIQNGVLGAFTVFSSLVSYTLGLMPWSTEKSCLYPIWAISLHFLNCCADSITAYSLDDNERYINQICLFLLYNIYLMLITQSYFGPLFYLVVAIAPYKFMQRFWAWKLASTSWNLSKTVADYMYEEHAKSGPSYDPISMKGYNYLVDWPLHQSKLEARILSATESTAHGAQNVIDIERIWQRSGLSAELKDVCLSFSLFHLLKRRFFGFPCAESSQQKTHDFVFKGLLSNNVDDGAVDYNRVFKVIEVELAFMYDFFFTKYAVLYYGSSKTSTILYLASATLISVTAYELRNYSACNSQNTKTADVVVAILALTCTALLELQQVRHYWTNIWSRVSFACNYVREQAVNTRGTTARSFCQKICMGFSEIVTQIGVSTSNKYYYENKLGQYSMLESVRYKHSPTKVRPNRSKHRRGNPLLPPHLDHLCETKDIHAQHYHKGCVKPSIKLPAEVKKALVDSLLRTQGIQASGESSLVYNGVLELLWVCRYYMHSSDSGIIYQRDKENQTQIILTWHIATYYCEIATLKQLSPRVGGELKLHLDIATILSKYCAYLVVSAPKLLPGHHYDTRLVFDAVTVEAARFLQEVEDKYEAMRELPESTETSIFRNGVKLGRQLEEMEDNKRWKVLADFWAELLLYLAPSDNVKEHIECLTNGGEFITHLWALLTHAGILDRGQRNVANIESSGTSHEPSPGEGISYSSPSTARAAPATCATNEPKTSGNYMQPTWMVQQQSNLVENEEIDQEPEIRIQVGVLNSEGSMHCTPGDFTENTSRVEDVPGPRV